MELHALSTGRKPRVATAMTMLKQMLYRCALILALLRRRFVCLSRGWRTDERKLS